MTRTLLRTAGLSLLALACACASPSDVQKLQSQISELQDQLAQVKRSAAGKDEVQNVNQRIVEQTNTLLKSNGQLVTKVDQIDTKVNQLTGEIETTNHRVDRVAQQATQTQHDLDEAKAAAARAAAAAQPNAATPVMPGAPAAPQPPSPPTAAGGEMNVAAPQSEDPAQTYQAAYRDYQKGNFDLAIAGFRDYMQRFPNSELSDNAAYWIGESLFSQKKYSESIEQFDTVVNKYSSSDKVPGSLLKKAYAYLALNDKARAIVQLQYVVHEHPRSQEAGLARQKLKQLGVDSK
jgi:tol-pal system protein YbgF